MALRNEMRRHTPESFEWQKQQEQVSDTHKGPRSYAADICVYYMCILGKGKRNFAVHRSVIG